MSIVTVANIKALGRIDTDAHDALLAILLESAEAYIEEECQIKLSTGTIEERVDGGYEQLWPRYLPVNSVTSVKDTFNDDEEIESTEYYNTVTQIIAEENGYWEEGRNRWKINYSYGYSDATAPVGLKLPLMQLVIRYYNNIEGMADQSAGTGGDYRTTWAKLMDTDILESLSKFSLKRVVE